MNIPFLEPNVFYQDNELFIAQLVYKEFGERNADDVVKQIKSAKHLCLNMAQKIQSQLKRENIMCTIDEAEVYPCTWEKEVTLAISVTLLFKTKQDLKKALTYVSYKN